METLTLTLHKSKDTKNKVVYGTADGSIIQSVYIDREALGKEAPESRQGRDIGRVAFENDPPARQRPGRCRVVSLRQPDTNEGFSEYQETSVP